MDGEELVMGTEFNGTVPVTSVPPAADTPNLTGGLVTDHVFMCGLLTLTPFTICTYCGAHYAKHLYQSGGYVYYPSTAPTYPYWQIPNYQPVWIGDYPNGYPYTVTYNVVNQADTTGAGVTVTVNSNGRQTTTDSREGSSLPT